MNKTIGLKFECLALEFLKRNNAEDTFLLQSSNHPSFDILRNDVTKIQVKSINKDKSSTNGDIIFSDLNFDYAFIVITDDANNHEFFWIDLSSLNNLVTTNIDNKWHLSTLSRKKKTCKIINIDQFQIMDGSAVQF